MKNLWSEHLLRRVVELHSACSTSRAHIRILFCIAGSRCRSSLSPTPAAVDRAQAHNVSRLLPCTMPSGASRRANRIASATLASPAGRSGRTQWSMWSVAQQPVEPSHEPLRPAKAR